MIINMNIEKELLKVLENHEQPLLKRLKIANNALNSPEVQFENLEITLLKWALELQECGGKSNLLACLDWLQSKAFQELNTTLLSNETVAELKNIVLHKLEASGKDKELQETVLHVAVHIIQVFQNYFRQDLDLYLEFLCDIVKSIKCDDFFLKFIKTEKIFPKKVVFRQDFSYKLVSQFFQPTLVNVIEENFINNVEIFEECSKMLQKWVFYKRISVFEEILETFYENSKRELNETEKKYLVVFDNLQTSSSTYQQLILHGFCASYGKKFVLCYKLLCVLVGNLGFHLQKEELNLEEIPSDNNKLENSIAALAKFLQIFENVQINFEYSLGKLNFTQFLQKLLLTVIEFTQQYQRRVAFYEIVNSVVKISPIAIEPIIDQLIRYVICAENENLENLYAKILLNIFQVFNKLHRIPSLISKLIRTLKPIYFNEDGNQESSREIFQFRGKDIKKKHKLQCPFHLEKNVKKMLPTEVLNYFSYCLNGLASWQVLNLYKTFIFHLSEITAEDKILNIGENETTFLDILCTFTNQFLSSVRICEHTVPLNVMEKFYLAMLDHSNVLRNLGSFIVSTQYNNHQVKILLESCYTWGEFLIILKHYSSTSNEKQIEIPLVIPTSHSFCDLTYLHSYLSSESWCLLSERIQNFGDQPCKELMFNICLQKLRAILVFEKTMDEEEFSSLIKNFSNLEEFSKIIVADKLCRSELIPKLESEVIARICEHLLETLEVPDATNSQVIESIINNRFLFDGFVVCLLNRLSQVFKGKKKRNSDGIKFSSTSKFLQLLNQINLRNLWLEDIDHLKEITENVFLSDKNSKKNDINYEKLKAYLNILRKCPLIYLSETKLTVLFVLFCSLLIDCKNTQNSDENPVLEDLQMLILGIIEFKPIPIQELVQSDAIFNFIAENFKKPCKVYEIYTNKCLKTLEGATSLVSGLKYLKENISSSMNVDFSIILLRNIQKHRKNSTTDIKLVLEDFKKKICELLETHLHTDEFSCDFKVLAALITVYVASNEVESLQKLEGKLEKCIENIFNMGKDLKQNDVEEEQMNVDDLENEENTRRDKLKTFEDGRISGKYEKNKDEGESQDSKEGILELFQIIYQHEKKFQNLIGDKDKFSAKIWCFLKSNLSPEIYPTLMVHILQNTIHLEAYQTVLDEFSEISLNNLNSNEDKFVQILKTWTVLARCSLNAEKFEKLKAALQDFLLASFSKCLSTNNLEIFDSFMELESAILQNTQLLLSPTILDIILSSVTLRMHTKSNFTKNFEMSMRIMETFIKSRQALIADRLPLYLQQYRTLVQYICKHANADSNSDESPVTEVANCAHMLEKLTSNLCAPNFRMESFASYLIADILKEYETVSLFPAVKVHLNNCLFSLIGLCTSEVNAFLLRVLSSGSAEIFKGLHESYKRHHRFTGKV